MRVAVLDLGTNTFNLLLAVFSEKNYMVERSEKIPVNLGRGGINLGKILPDAFDRGIAAMETYRRMIDVYQPDKTFAFATSAIRNAGNGKEFVKSVKQITGLDINVIDGDNEASLIYDGVRLSGSLEQLPCMIMDIGGGSTEFIIGDLEKIYWKQSFELGAARLFDKFSLSDPITQEEIFMVEEYLAAELQTLDLAVREYKPVVLIGSSGSFDTLAEIIANRFYNERILDQKTTWEFKLDDYYSIHEQLMRSTRIERLRSKGIMEMRVDMIVVATLFVYFIIMRYGIRRMKLSTYALKEGVLNRLLNEVSPVQ